MLNAVQAPGSNLKGRARYSVLGTCRSQALISIRRSVMMVEGISGIYL